MLIKKAEKLNATVRASSFLASFWLCWIFGCKFCVK